jgi:hypothetical protein
VSAIPVHVYIYYRISTPHAAEAHAALSDVMAALRAEFTVSTRLLRGQGDASLWMEVYENVAEPARFEAVLNGLLEKSRFGSWLATDSARRTERFVALEA